MAKPAEVPEWATDTNYSSGVDIGTPTKVDPGSGVKAQGHVPGTRGAAQTMNWWKNLVGSWVGWVNETFGEDSGEWVYVDSSGAPTPKTRTIIITGPRFRTRSTGTAVYAPGGGGGGFLNSAGALRLQSNSVNVDLELQALLPHGAEITRIRAMVTPGASGRAGLDRLYVTATRRPAMDFDAPSADEETTWSSIWYQAASTSLQTIDSGAVALSIDSGVPAFLVVKGGADAGTNNDFLYGVEITFSDPGPRNF